MERATGIYGSHTFAQSARPDDRATTATLRYCGTETCKQRTPSESRKATRERHGAKEGPPKPNGVPGSPVQCGRARDRGKSRASPQQHTDHSAQEKGSCGQSCNTEETGEAIKVQKGEPTIIKAPATGENPVEACGTTMPNAMSMWRLRVPHGDPPSHALAKQHLNEYRAQTHGPGASALTRTQQQSLEQVASSRRCQRTPQGKGSNPMGRSAP